MIVLRRTWTYRAPLCRDHGTEIARNWLLATLLMGWWGLISFFVNFGAIATDLNALRTARALAPAGSVVVPGGFGMASSGSPANMLPRVPGRQLGLVIAVVVLAIGALAVSAIFGPKQASDLAVGDCFDDPATTDVVQQVAHHPCFQAHTSEVFAIVSYPAGGSYPTDDQLQTYAEQACGPIFDSYTGGGTGLAADVTVNFFAPTSDGWSGGDHRLICYLTAPSGQTLTQSLKAASQ